MMKKAIHLGVSLVLLSMAAEESHAFTETQIDDAVQHIIAPAMSPTAPTKSPVALVAGVITTDGVQKVYSWGTTALNGSVSADGETLFEIASISKTFTATLLAQEVEDGTIKLTDPISSSACTAATVSAFCYKGTASTYLNLATHTAGLPDSPNTPGYFLDMYTRPEINQYLSSISLDAPPGTAYSYSNLGFGYLADLISDAEGETFNQLVHDQITQPLGMNNTEVVLADYQAPLMNAGYSGQLQSGDFTRQRLYNFTDQSALAGAAAVHSTADDLLIYLSAEMGITQTPLSSAMGLSQTPEFSHAPSTSPLAVALGWEILIDNDITYHSGALPGFDSFIGFNNQTGIGVVILTNTSFYESNGVYYDQATDLGIQLLFSLIPGLKYSQPSLLRTPFPSEG